MFGKNYCSTKKPDSDDNVTVNVNVEVHKIVKCWCVTGIIIVGIVFAYKAFTKLMDADFLGFEE